MTNQYLEKLFSLQGKVALVTGGHKGIGKMIADGLRQAGCRVYIASRSVPAGSENALPCDLSSMDAISALADTLAEREGHLDILVNNAGYFTAAPLPDVDAEHWAAVMDVNVRAPFFLVQKLLPLLQQGATDDDPARVINIGSIGGVMGPSNMAYAYGASKAALQQLTRNLAADLTALKVTVNAILPGYFPSDMTDGFFTAQPGLKDEIVNRTPRGRLGTAEDIAGLTIALCGRSGAYLSGTITPLDGGVLLT